MDDQLLMTGCTFGAVTMAGYFVATVLLRTNNGGRQIRSRLSDQGRGASAAARHRGRGILPLLQRIGQAASGPFMPNTREKQSSLRQSLARAGIYSPSAVKPVSSQYSIWLPVTS